MYHLSDPPGGTAAGPARLDVVQQPARLDAQEQDAEMVVAAVTAEAPTDFGRSMELALEVVATRRAQHLRDVAGLLGEVMAAAAVLDMDISAFASGVRERVEHVLRDGDAVHERAMRAARLQDHYQCMRLVQMERGIRLRLRLAWSETQHMWGVLCGGDRGQKHVAQRRLPVPGDPDGVVKKQPRH